MKFSLYITIIVIIVFMIGGMEFIGCQRSEKVKLYFREDWREIPAEVPVTQMHVNNPELIMERHGPAADSIKKSHHDQPADDPWYIWSGLCNKPWALTLQKKNSIVDLSYGGRIHWRTKQFGDRILRIVLGLEDGTWLVSEQGTGKSSDWEVFTLTLDDLRWRNLGIENVNAGKLINDVNLKRVKFIGFTDLMPGEGSEECSRLDWIEVYGK